jgi:hypothetical protein
MRLYLRHGVLKGLKGGNKKRPTCLPAFFFRSFEVPGFVLENIFIMQRNARKRDMAGKKFHIYPPRIRGLEKGVKKKK